MSFLLFAARKMQLKREINANSYEQIVVQNQLQAAQKRVSQFQEHMTAMKNMTSVFAQGLQASANQAAYAQYAQSNTDELAEKLRKQQAGEQVSFTNEDYQRLSQIATVGQQGGAALAQAFSAVSDSIFTSVSNVQLAVLQAESTRLENKQTSLKTEGQLLAAEYQEYDQAISSAIKEATPKFGLA